MAISGDLTYDEFIKECLNYILDSFDNIKSEILSFKYEGFDPIVIFKKFISRANTLQKTPQEA